jgi:predicted DCC family thiol-disulfide oxidoreductase YuxK
MSAPVLLYDGTCGLCGASVRFVLRHERRHDLRFAALHGAFAHDILLRHPHLHDIDSLVWYEVADRDGPERVLTRSAAVLKALEYLGGPWRLGRVAAVVPPRVLDAAYRLVARHRHRVFGHTCAVPAEGGPDRFLD